MRHVNVRDLRERYVSVNFPKERRRNRITRTNSPVPCRARFRRALIHISAGWNRAREVGGRCKFCARAATTLLRCIAAYADRGSYSCGSGIQGRSGREPSRRLQEPCAAITASIPVARRIPSAGFWSPTRMARRHFQVRRLWEMHPVGRFEASITVESFALLGGAGKAERGSAGLAARARVGKSGRT